MRKNSYNLMRDLAIITFGILIAVIFVKTGLLESMLVSLEKYRILVSLLAGMFWVSAFTVMPATIVIITIAHSNSILFVAAFASLGALFGDLIVFRFVKDNFSKDLTNFVQHSRLKKMHLVMRVGPFRWVLAVLGAMIIASPLPDDFGLLLMGFSQLRSKIFIPLFLILNFLGILTITFVAK